jgi:protein-disulfide isomerase
MKKSAIKTALIVVQAVLVLLIVQQIIRISAPVADSVYLADPFLGPENASIVVIEYSDFQCPFCAAATGNHRALVERLKTRMPGWAPSVPALESLAREGKIKLVFKHFPLSFHSNAQKAAEASEAANAQGKFWEFHDALFRKEGTFSYADLLDIAGQIGLDTARFKSELDSGMYADSVKKDMEEGQKAGVDGTPAFFVNGVLISGAEPFSTFEKEFAGLK